MRRAVAFLALVPLCGCMHVYSGNRVHERFEKTLPSAGVTALHLRSTAGTVRIQAWNRPQIRIVAVKDAADAKALGAVHIAVARSAGVVDVETRYEAGLGVSGGGVEYAVMLPARIDVDVQNTAGTVRMQGLTGNVTADTKAGTVEATLPAPLRDQHVELSATTGTVTLRIPKNSSATVTAHSTIGSFESDFPGVKSEERHLVGEGASGKIGSGSASVDLSTTTGSIYLRST